MSQEKFQDSCTKECCLFVAIEHAPFRIRDQIPPGNPLNFVVDKLSFTKHKKGSLKEKLNFAPDYVFVTVYTKYDLADMDIAAAVGQDIDALYEHEEALGEERLYDASVMLSIIEDMAEIANTQPIKEVYGELPEFVMNGQDYAPPPQTYFRLRHHRQMPFAQSCGDN